MESNAWNMDAQPVLEQLAARYLAGRSRCMTYARTRQLMEAVLYCMEFEQAGEDRQLQPKNEEDGTLRYQRGLAAVQQAVRKAQLQYSRMAEAFRDFGNRNLRDTFHRAIPGFFRLYDPIFAPQETLITMDYPVLNQDVSLCGVRAVQVYLDRLELEQEFLHLFPEPLAVRTLLRFDPDYRRQFYNLSGALLRCVLVTALRQEVTGVRTASSAVCLAAWRKTTAPAQQEAKLELLLQQLTAGRCPHPQAVCRYLAPELHGFVQQLAVTRQEGLGHLAVCME